MESMLLPSTGLRAQSWFKSAVWSGTCAGSLNPIQMAMPEYSHALLTFSGRMLFLSSRFMDKVFQSYGTSVECFQVTQHCGMIWGPEVRSREFTEIMAASYSSCHSQNAMVGASSTR